MVRLATEMDAEQLERLNIEFNGEGETTLEAIRDSLLNNQQELVFVDDENGLLTGFVCVQLKRSFCYDKYTPEITEVYVKEEYRKRGIASAMIRFAENCCRENFPLQKFELLTGKNNKGAQTVYGKLGYREDGELHLIKRTK
ncbi:MAG: GNAT family N-acetyltransferase [Lachnospiraceae bacterium]|nr:GNAT family N-acetyltransferase [Lachnospiraceae bacterium]